MVNDVNTNRPYGHVANLTIKIKNLGIDDNRYQKVLQNVLRWCFTRSRNNVMTTKYERYHKSDMKYLSA